MDERDKIRKDQDTLIELCQERGIDLDLQLSYEYPGSPTIRELIAYIQPEWHYLVKRQIAYLSNES